MLCLLEDTYKPLEKTEDSKMSGLPVRPMQN